MLAMSKGGLRAAQAEKYYHEKYTRDDYYSEARTITGEWYGQGAERLGLEGAVQREQFQAILQGHDPRTGETLIEMTHEGERRAGWDATFNAPKSVSLQATIGDDRRLLEAHQTATDRALAELEHFVQSRQHGGTERVTTGNMVAARFDHMAARPSASGVEKGVGADPHLHTHVVIANLTQRADGAWRAVEPLEIYRSQEYATAVYRSTLAQEVQRLGYEIRHTGQKGAWELAGYNREPIEAFSQRRQDITKHLAERGLDSPAAAQIAAHQTRLAKDGRDEQSLRSEWQERAQAIGLDAQRLTAAARERGPVQHADATDRVYASDQAVRYASEYATERDAVMDVRTVEAAALQLGMGEITLDDVRSAIRSQQHDGELIAVQNNRLPQGGFTTEAMVELERDNLRMMQAGRGQAQPVAHAEEVRAWATQRGLYVDQAQVVEQTLTSRDWLTSIEGKAGATKTTTMGAVREFAEAQGYTVRGFGPTTGSVRALQEAGVQAETVAHLNQRQMTAGQGHTELWVVDESSLLSTKHMHTLLRQAETAQTARVVFVGDQRQHGAIEAGRPVAQMQAAGMTTARLETIRRQRDPELRQAVEAAAKGHTADAVQQLDAQGRVTEIPERAQRYATIAQEYARGMEHGQNVLVVSPANDERTALNATIRAELQTRGLVEREGQEHTILVNRQITGTERSRAVNYEVGDVVQFHSGSRKHEIAPGSYARVEAVDREQNLLTVRTASESVVTYAPVKLKGVEVYREEQREFAQGERIQFRAPVREQQVSNGALGRIERLEDNGQVSIRLDNGKTVTTSLTQLPHLEYGYATTSHSSQGATVDRVLVHVDTERSAALVNRQQFYVSISRARHDAQVFTNSKEQLPQAVNREVQKSTALEAVRETQRETVPRHQQWRHEELGHGREPRPREEWRQEQKQDMQRSKGIEQDNTRSEKEQQPQQEREREREREGFSRGSGLGRGR